MNSCVLTGKVVNGFLVAYLGSPKDAVPHVCQVKCSDKLVSRKFRKVINLKVNPPFGIG